jgi:subtilisin family serine protease
MRKLIFLLAMLACLPAFALTSPDLQNVISRAKPADLIPVDVVLQNQMDQADLNNAVNGLVRADRRVRVAQILKDYSQWQQASLLGYLNDQAKQGKAADITPLWIINAVYCRATAEVIQALSQRAGIAYVDYDLKKIDLEKQVSKPVPGGREIAWGVRKIRANQVWPLGYTGAGVVVGHIDTGCNYNHRDLADHMWTDANYPNHGWNFELSTNDPMDIQGHGTHTAGTVASDGTAGSQCGVAPDAQVMSCRVRTTADSVAEWQVFAAMQFVCSPPLSPTHGGDVITMSLGWRYAWAPHRSTWRTSCNNVGAAGIVMIIAAGNENGVDMPPACLRCPGDVPPPWRHPQNGATGALSDVVSIGATDSVDIIGTFSAVGPVTWAGIAPFNDYLHPPGLQDPDVSAPGVYVKSCDYANINGYADGWSGTSMATPHTAGTVALMLQKNSYLTPAIIDSILETTAVDLGVAGKDSIFGSGRIDALNAVNATPFPFALTPLAYRINDPAPGGNNNGLWESGEQVQLIVPIYNQLADTVRTCVATLTTADGYVTINNGTANLGNMTPHDTVDAIFVVTASASTPPMHLANFTLNLAHTGGNTNYPLQVYINPLPDLVYQHFIVTGGNGNGILDPGETANLIVTVKNSGFAPAGSVTSVLRESSPYITLVDSSGNYGTIAVNDTANNLGDPYTVTAAAGTPIGTSVPLLVRAVSGSYVDTFTFNVTVGRLMPSDTGYYYTYWSHGPYFQAPTYSWYAIDSTQSLHPGTPLNMTDDMTSAVTIPFTFRYYGVNYTAIAVCSNGWVALGTETSTNYTNVGLPSASAPAKTVFGIWDDLNPGAAGPGEVYYYNDATNHRFVVEWFRVDHYGATGTQENFEIMLYNPAFYPTPTGDGEIIVQYLNAMRQADNTVGIQNSSQNVGIQYYLDGTYNALGVPITDTFALKFTTVKPTLVGIKEGEVLSLPGGIRPLTVFPSVSRGRVQIAYSIGQSAKGIELKIYDISGRLVKTFDLGPMPSAQSLVTWTGDDDAGRQVAAGVYFVKLTADDQETVEKAVLLR